MNDIFYCFFKVFFRLSTMVYSLPGTDFKVCGKITGIANVLIFYSILVYSNEMYGFEINDYLFWELWRCSEFMIYSRDCSCE